MHIVSELPLVDLQPYVINQHMADCHVMTTNSLARWKAYHYLKISLPTEVRES